MITEKTDLNAAKGIREKETAEDIKPSSESVISRIPPSKPPKAIDPPNPALVAAQVTSSSLGLTSKPIDSKRYKVHQPVNSSSGTLLKYIDRNEAGQQRISSSTVYPAPNFGTIKTALTKDGWEYQIDPLPNQTVLNGQKVLERMPVSWYGVGNALIYTPQSGDFLLPAPLGKTPSGASYRTNVAELEKLGYELIGQFGASFKSFSPKQGSISLRYFWHHSQGIDPKVGQSAPNIL